jgi:uncharacterized protein (DUF697 family)
MSLPTTGALWKILREVDLGKIRREAEERFSLLVVGAEPLAGRFAEALSREEGRGGVHPWLRLNRPEDVPEPGGASVAVLVSDDVEPYRAFEGWLSALYRSEVPAVTVVVASGAKGQRGATLPRPLERERVAIEGLSAEALSQHVAPALLVAMPESHRLALARHLPGVRQAYVRTLVEETSRANAVYVASTGLAKVVPVLNIPLNVADTVILTKNQLVMAYRIALAAGKTGEPKDVMGEVLGVVGGGVFFRQLARELVGLIPLWGIVPNVAVSYAGTQVIGRAVALWALQGTKLARSDLKALYREALSRGRAVAAALLAKRRRRQGPKALPRRVDSREG